MIIYVIAIIFGLPIIIILCLALGSLLRWINEGKNFKSPMDSQLPFQLMFKDPEFYKTLVTGIFILITLLYLFKVI